MRVNSNYFILLIFLFTMYSGNCQNYIWDRFSDIEFSEALILLKSDGAKAFDLKSSGMDEIRRFNFLNDSVLIDENNLQAYVIRENIVLPILSKSDSSNYYDFYKNKRRETYDSLTYRVDNYYESSIDNIEILAFKTIKCPDTIISISYEEPKYTHTEIRENYTDSTLIKNIWMDYNGETISFLTIYDNKKESKNLIELERKYVYSEKIRTTRTILTRIEYKRNRIKYLIYQDKTPSESESYYEFTKIKYY